MPPSSRRNVYIQEGRIQRRTSFFDWTRFLVIVFIAVLLFITNPGNESLPNLFRKHLQRETTTFWHSLSPSPSPYWRWTTSSAYSGIVSTTTNTNYGIFSLQKKSSGISISVLLHSLPLCRLDYDSSYSPTFYACDILAKSMCHGKPLLWDSTDRVHTAHRILCVLFMIVAILQFSMPQSTPPYWNEKNWLLDHLGSALLIHTSSVYTLLDLHLCIYPALQDMDRMISTLKWQDHIGGNPNWTFAFGVVVLVLVIGGGANSIASLCVGRYTYGWGPIVAASLAYSCAVGRLIVFRFGAWPVIPLYAFWTRFASTLFRNVGGGIAWLLAGLAGFMLGEYHQGRQTTWGYIQKYLK